jgi:hypothetical protein
MLSRGTAAGRAVSRHGVHVCSDQLNLLLLLLPGAGCAVSCVEGVHVCDGPCVPFLKCTATCPGSCACSVWMQSARCARIHPPTACTRFHQIARHPIRAHALPSEHTRAFIRVRTCSARASAHQRTRNPTSCRVRRCFHQSTRASIRAHTHLDQSARAIRMQAPRSEHWAAVPTTAGSIWLWVVQLK